MCSHRLESLGLGYVALAESSQSLARYGTERSRHGADPLSESPIRSACKSCILAQHLDVQGTKHQERQQLPDGCNQFEDMQTKNSGSQSPVDRMDRVNRSTLYLT